ncbi:phosphoserine aminotransferase [Schizosaccharomyces octosporus yFS286]|uniref:phosphoserine transaminase n=1 Tax=Schizosaccharomyces octosporus (strain yFS286) TaxID=483514 RepID=S9R6H5_SCHOY|nr:phosphoserine aminotransferase [Schizosaccharomyces octosporus yFS286]EPX73905.1 phosphoserine aminotransferase [Schizosaccharomyces octosporus yFS286]
MPTRQDVINFAAGPAGMATDVVEEYAKDFVNFQNLGMGVGEISHRSKEGTGIVNRTEESLRRMYGLPDNFHILFMQGGGTEQFAAVLYNVYAHHALYNPNAKKLVANYIVTGSWSKKALNEAQRLGFPCHVAADTKELTGKYGCLPKDSDLNYTPAGETSLVYWCDNETIHGVEFNEPPANIPKGAIRVCDCSSNFISRRIDFSKHDILFAGAQKNAGPAGITMVFVRDSILERALVPDLHKMGIPVSTTMADYKLMADSNSLYNTLPIPTLHAINLGLQYMEKKGGLPFLEEASLKKSQMVYQVLDKYPIYENFVDSYARSRMNVTFRINNQDLENKFLVGAEELNMMQLKGHRSIGGVRVSLYNAITIEQTERLVKYLESFGAEHSK